MQFISILSTNSNAETPRGTFFSWTSKQFTTVGKGFVSLDCFSFYLHSQISSDFLESDVVDKDFIGFLCGYVIKF